MVNVQKDLESDSIPSSKLIYHIFYKTSQQLLLVKAMQFIKDQEVQAQDKSTEYENHYQSRHGWILRRVFLIHCIQYLIDLKNVINVSPNHEKLSLSQVKNIQEEDSAVRIDELFSENYKRIVDNKEDQQLLGEDLMWMVFKMYQKQYIAGFLIRFLGLVAGLALCYFMTNFFESISEQNIKKGLIWGAILIILWIITIQARMVVCDVEYPILQRIKNGLTMLLYSKILKMTPLTIGPQMGTITSLIVNDMAVFTIGMNYATYIFVFPFALIGGALVLYLLISWVGLMSLGILLLLTPLNILISQKNGEISKEINGFKDKKVKITREVIEGIKSIKLYGWQTAFQRTIKALRSREMEGYFKLGFGKAVERALGNFIVMASPFIMLLLAKGEVKLSSSLIFSVMILMNNIKYYISLSFIGLGFYYQFKVVFDRLASILSLSPKFMIQLGPKQHQHQIFPSQLQKGEIVLREFDGFWQSQEEKLSEPTLKNITCRFRSGTLYGVTGKVGAGKSSFFSVILREMPYFRGNFQVNGEIAFVEQQPILFSETVRSNILFGQKYQQEKYEAVVKRACLTSDFKLLAKGDQTVVGEKGVTLSGGQKARVSLARALYSEADIYLMDDPLSAVDSKVAREIFYSCLRPLSETKTVIVASHQINFVEECQEILILENGSLVGKGSLSQLRKRLQELKQSFRVNDDEDQDVVSENRPPIALEHQEERRHSQQKKQLVDVEDEKFNDKEVEVNWETYARFFFSNKRNYFLLPATVLMFVVSEFINTMYYRFMAQYDKVSAGTSGTFHDNFTLFWAVSGGFIVLYLVTLIIKYFLIYIVVLESTRSLHDMMLTSILRSPSSYFDSISSGTLTNRFSNDLGLLNNDLPYLMTEAMEGAVLYFVVLLNLFQINQLIIIPAVIIMSVAGYFFITFRSALAKGKELQLSTKSSIYHVTSQASGAVTQIRIYHQNQNKTRDFRQALDKSIKASLCFLFVSRGFGISLTWIITLFVVVSLFITIITSNAENSHLFPVTVIYLMMIGEDLQWILRQAINMDGSMVSAQRIDNLQENKEEALLRTPYDETVGLAEEVEAAERQEDCHIQWPKQPVIRLDNFSARYRDNLPLVLKNISLEVKPGEKVGIVGRTGAGKSSIIQALFRMFEAELHSLYEIGGFDALKMGLHSVRQHISVIPQTPFLFQGTVRENIDPFEHAEDQQVWQVLQEAGLKMSVQSLPNQLETEVSNNSEVFSVGQKQLLCIARALLRRNRFLVLDEATSNVDMKTDAFVQEIIRTQFRETTVITIAHRLFTVADYDKIVVMREGRVEEVGSPYALLEKRGLFYEMVMHTGRQSEMIFAKARNRFESKQKND